jgi:hypothetical protein
MFNKETEPKTIPPVIEADPVWEEIYHTQEAPGHCAAGAMHLGFSYSQKLLQEKKGVVLPIPTESQIYEATNITNLDLTTGLMASYLSRYFSDMGVTYGALMQDLFRNIYLGNFVIVNWWDDLPPQPDDGHSSVVAGYDLNSSTITLVDPSKRGKDRLNYTFSNNVVGIWKPSITFFEERWFDIVGENYSRTDLIVPRPMIWINPLSLNRH